MKQRYPSQYAEESVEARLGGHSVSAGQTGIRPWAVEEVSNGCGAALHDSCQGYMGLIVLSGERNCKAAVRRRCTCEVSFDEVTAARISYSRGHGEYNQVDRRYTRISKMTAGSRKPTGAENWLFQVKFHTKTEDSHEETRQTAPVKIGMPMKGRCQIEDRKSTKGKLITPVMTRTNASLQEWLVTWRGFYTPRPKHDEDSLDFGEET
ncbi:hypothetical protein DFH08DRAFT_805991 [Mycena albidolilacea]|uniref:Uncharacterized protein n=1 Tax=Mycena albidolilacea TaxID=1033008 RepID=A0AAD7A7I9_9AGAR|nr:hypothetical protein DFH08DRAFT_805991 [Mycena albidolilacea]